LRPQLLLSPTMAVAGALCESLVSSSHDYESVCNSLLIIFRHNRLDMRLVEWALQNEIETCGAWTFFSHACRRWCHTSPLCDLVYCTEGGTTATLFRGMTVGVKLVSIYLHIKGHFFLKGVLQPLIAQMQTTPAIEVRGTITTRTLAITLQCHLISPFDGRAQVDPMKLADLSQLPDNQKKLTDCVEHMFLAMESAIEIFPT
jgi:hypothetical protein